MTEPPQISVVMVSWNCRDEVLACLDSIQRHPPACPWEVVVVDNGSRDGTVEAVRESYPGVQVVANDNNRGLSFANNQGMAATTGDTIVFTNPDVLFHETTLDAVRDCFVRRPRAGLLALRLTWPDGVVQTSTGDLPLLGESLRGRQLQRALSDGSPTGYCWDGWPHDEERLTGRAGDACYAARRRAVLEVGAQDERFPLDWEAIDWSRRMRDAGWEIWFTPTAHVTHLGGASTSNAPAFRYVWQTHLGMAYYFAKAAPAGLRPAVHLIFRLRALAKWCLMAAGVPMWRLAHRGRT